MAKDSIDKATDRQIAEIDKELNEMYARAALEIREKSEDFAREFEKKDAKKRKLVEEGKLDKAEYERWRNTQIFQSENYKQLENNIAAEMANTNQTAIDYVNGELPKTYAHAYNGFGAGIASVAVGYDFALLNNDSLIALSEVEAKKLNVPKDTAWTNKKIRAEVAQGIAQGESTTAIAKRFEKIGVSEGAAAKRLARTMIGGAQNGGKQAAMQRASASGIIMGKQWKAFHDARTRDSHIMLDNEIVAVDDACSNGCRYPRDPEGAPGEICNCRCGMSGKVMGFRHADGSVTMVDMSVNCTEMPEGIFPPGYTYSQWKQDAQNRITTKQLREEELAAAENPGYGNSLFNYMAMIDNDWTGIKPTQHTKFELDSITRYANSKGISVYNIESFDGDIDMLKEQIDVIAETQNEWGIKTEIVISVGVMDDNCFAKKNNRTITINRKALMNREITEKNLQSSNYLAANYARGISRHEMGHFISKQYGEKGVALAKQAYYNTYGESISTEELLPFLFDNVSEYSNTYMGFPDRPVKESFYQEITPEILSKNTSDPTDFSIEFERLLKETIL